MGLILLAFGLVLIIEGLVYALAPHLVEQLLETLRALSVELRRQAGLIAMALGVVLVWLAFLVGI